MASPRSAGFVPSVVLMLSLLARSVFGQVCFPSVLVTCVSAGGWPSGNVQFCIPSAPIAGPITAVAITSGPCLAISTALVPTFPTTTPWKKKGKDPVPVTGVCTAIATVDCVPIDFQAILNQILTLLLDDDFDELDD